MKTIDLLDLTQKYELFSPSLLSLFEKHLEYKSLHVRTQIDYTEIDVLTTFVKMIIDTLENGVDMNVFKGFFYGFIIPQISVEFDLLKITDNSVIVIELKSELIEEKAVKQLKRQKYYLKYLSTGKEFNQYLFNKQDMTIYCLSDDEKTLEICRLYDVYQKILDSKNSTVLGHLEELFNPTQFLVSPFNETEKFLAEEYFLTEQQEKDKKKIIDQIEEENFNVITITGGPGTGKSLLVYDICSTMLKRNMQVAIIHCGNLNEGHEKLIDSGYFIKPIKIYRECLNNEINVLIIDEVQRINPVQFEQIMEFCSGNNIFVILSYDKKQFLKHEESGRLTKQLENYSDVTKIELTGKIRRNPVLNEFTQLLFGKYTKKKQEHNFLNNVYTYYANTYDEAFAKIKEINKDGLWKEIYYLPSKFTPNISTATYYFYCNRKNESSNCFEVLGQEYDNVITFIDNHFYYDISGNLVSSSSDFPGLMYHKAFFQNITRTRKKLFIVVINNPEIYERILEVIC